ncbi:MAG: glycosyltransferase family 4 protein [Patescibacteria group bacterium]|jgi:phosphatidylinositol alpha-1,6-mannosyltransferase
MASEIKKSLLITLDFPPRFGGVASYYYNVCKNLPADKIVVLAPNQPGAEAFDRQQNFPIIRKKLITNFPQVWPASLFGIFKLAASIKWLSIIRYMAKIAKTHNIEIIQVGQVLPIGTVALAYQKRKKIPYLFYAHGLDLTLPQKFLRKKTLLKKIIAGASAIIANSHWTNDELVRLGADAKKITVVYPGPEITPAASSSWKADEIFHRYHFDGKKIILSVGRLVERKGHDLVIKALPQIIKQLPAVMYVIIGDGPYRQTLENLVNQYQLRDYMTFLGAKKKEETAAFYQNCDVFAMPSRQLPNGDVEGFGIVFLEANSFGKPVIGGKSGGVPEAVLDGQTGILIDPASIDEMAQAAIKILSDRSYAERLGLQGLERVTSQFDWPTQVEKIKQVLK